MRARVNLLAVVCSAFGFAFAAPPALADGSGQAGADRFVPSLTVGSGVEIQSWDAAVSSDLCAGCSFPDPSSVPMRASARGSDLDVTPFVDGTLELMSPELPVLGSPRFFVGARFGGSFGVERNAAREGDPGRLESPLPEADMNTPIEEDSVLGQGSEVIAVRDRITYGARAGVAVPFELFGRPLRARASVEWLRFGVELDGEVKDVECLPDTNCNVNAGGFLREIPLRASDDETFDALGPGLEIEMDTGRWGPIGSSIAVGVQALKVISDTEVEFSSPVLVIDDVLGTDEHRADFSFEVEDWMFRTGVQFRLHWLGYAP